jgi:uncharacterized protein
VVFAHEGEVYHYGFAATRERVVSEFLHCSKMRRDSMLFERTMDDVRFGNKFKKEGSDLVSLVRPNALFLSVAAMFNGAVATSVVSWFRNLRVVRSVVDDAFLAYTLHELHAGEHKVAVKQLLLSLDFGFTDLEAVPVPWERDGMTLQTIYNQYVPGGQVTGQVRLDLSEEADGVKKIVALAGVLVDTLAKGKVLVVDDLDAGLHPLLAAHLVRLFNSKESNPHGAQLIFTAKDPSLMDSHVMRADQLFLTERSQHGEANLYAVIEFKDIDGMNIPRSYIQGRFGGIPFLPTVHS